MDQLAELRSEGMHKILNYPVSTVADLYVLVAYTKDWWKQIKAVLESHFSKAEQLNFTRLETVPNVIFPHTY